MAPLQVGLDLQELLTLVGAVGAQQPVRQNLEHQVSRRGHRSAAGCAAALPRQRSFCVTGS